MKEVSRRSMLATIMALPAIALASKSARAFTAVDPKDGKLQPADGLWKVLDHVTDGTDPSPSVIAPPKFSAEMHALVGKQVTLTGYLMPLTGGFGKKQEYLLSRGTFHCPYCYAYGRGSLVLAQIDGHVGDATKPVTVTGTFALQEKDAGDFYFQLAAAKIA